MLPPMIPYPFTSTSADFTVYTGAALLRGWMVSESAGAAATFEIWDGASETTGIGPMPIGLAANETTRDFVTHPGILIRTAIFVEMLTGSIKGSIFYTPITHADDLNLMFGEWDPILAHPGV